MKRLYLLFCLSLFVFKIQAQTSDYRLHSVFIYNVSKYFQWPASAGENFVIGVLGSSNIKGDLEKFLSAKPIHNKKVLVREYNSTAEIAGCDIIFIPALQSAKMDEVLSKAKGRGILVITEQEGLGKKGSPINFVKIDGKLRFELNRAAVQGIGFQYAPELENVSIVL